MKDFFDTKLKLSKTYKYEHPHMIILSGLPGSGKTHLSKRLSQELQIFLLSNDYLRNYYQQKIKSKKLVEYLVKIVNLERIIQIIRTQSSFVLDASINKIGKLHHIEKFAQKAQYDLIKIKVYSGNDQQNLERIAKRYVDLTQVDEHVLGDNAQYSKPYSTEEYFEIIRGKKIQIEDNYFDYCISNNKTLEDFEQNINTIITDIKSKRLIRKP